MNTYILYKLIVENPKSRLEYIKDVIDSLAAKFKVMEEVQQPSKKKKKLEQLPPKRKRDCVLCSDRVNKCRKRSRFRCTQSNKGVHPLSFEKHTCV